MEPQVPTFTDRTEVKLYLENERESTIVGQEEDLT
jgi:hypothetical protein